jgi:hypothetical protein
MGAGAWKLKGNCPRRLTVGSKGVLFSSLLTMRAEKKRGDAMPVFTEAE